MEYVLRITHLLELMLVAVGGLTAIWAIYQLISSRVGPRGGGSTGEDWWMLALGAFLAVVGASGFISGVIGSITM